jgi:hypothetical protein
MPTIPENIPSRFEVKKYLTHLALKQRVVSSTLNQALHTLLILFRHVLKKDSGFSNF